ncbi:N-acetylmuramoyl-L-alanine amidase [Streptomyces sp. NPDC058045]|uniref:N-acetylmuramoyl-L-alanine amidase n=1 Tax=Streptomyces sp. NPDC058045 TaxID=3346311 RepID=UPI0036E7DF58
MSTSTPPTTRLRVSLLAVAVTAALSATGVQATAAPQPDPTSVTVNAAFEQAADKYGVPRDLLVAVGYGETHLDGHHGQPSQDRGYGVMHLVSNPVNHSLAKAAALTGHSRAELRHDTAANIEGGAAVLRAHADELGLNRAERRDLGAWYPVVARYSNAKGATAALYADTVYRFLAKGVTANAAGEKVTVAGRSVAPDKSAYRNTLKADGFGTMSEDYPPAHWVPASPSNYNSGRSADISTIVIHVVQGSYDGSIGWFQNPEAESSAHYIVRSSDGDITQMVRDSDTAWHARGGNPYSVGIEHEGFIDNPSWFTDAMYRSSAALTKHLADRYGIPKDRAHIVGHSEVPGNDHTDPGPNWNWDYYMQLVGGSGGDNPPPPPPPSTGKHWVDTFADAPGYASPSDTTETGTLNKGTNYVYCKAQGRDITDNSGNHNHWWLRTDLDSGPGGQYVPAYYLSRWGNDEARDNDGNEIPDC